MGGSRPFRIKIAFVVSEESTSCAMPAINLSDFTDSNDLTALLDVSVDPSNFTDSNETCIDGAQQTAASKSDLKKGDLVAYSSQSAGYFLYHSDSLSKKMETRVKAV